MSSDNAETTIPIESNTTTNIVTTAESDSTTSKGLTSSSSSAFEPTALDAPGTSSTTEVTTATITSTTATAVDNAGELAEQARVIRDLDQGDGKVLLVEGANWYLISCSWFQKWQEYVGYDNGTAPNGIHPGPIDNSALLAPEANGDHTILAPYIQEFQNYLLVPQQMWDLFVSWYGGGPAIPREVVKRAYSKQPTVDVRLLRLNLLKSSNLKAPPVVLCISKYASVRVLREKGCALLGVDVADVQLWDYHQHVKAKLLSGMTESLFDENIIDQQPVLFEERNADGTWPRMMSARDYHEAIAVVPGRCGLVNLGNTCFMNSALQCLSATAPLRRFLVSGVYRADVNAANALGCGGELAMVFAELLSALWAGRYLSVAPRDFKSRLERFAQQFAGYEQHDSQELLAFLLDGLHEDLNRVKVKPYVEAREAEGRPDAIAAADAWTDHKRRNDSIIVDWFQGQLKSTVECNVCDRVSVTFDPFMYLSVPLPVPTTRDLAVTLVRRDGSPPERYRLVLEKAGAVQHLKQALSKLCGIPPTQMVVADIYMSRVHADLEDDKPLTEVSVRDDIYVYEVLPPARVVPVVSETATATTTDAAATAATTAAREHSTDTSSTSTSMNTDDDDNTTSTNTSVASTSAPPTTPPPPPPPVTLDVPPPVVREPTGAAPGHAGDANVYLIVQFKHSTNSYHLFSLPQILSFSSVPTFAELASDVYRRIKRTLADQPPPPLSSSFGDNAVRNPLYASTDGDDAASVMAATGVALASAASPDSASPALAPVGTSSDTTTATTDAAAAGQQPSGPLTEAQALADMAFSVLVNTYTDKQLLPGTGGPLDISSRDTITVTLGGALDLRYDAKLDRAYAEHASFAATSSDANVTPTLYDCLKLYMQREQLGADNPWYCSKCQEHRQAYKKFDIWRAPPVLVVHLKRFSYSSLGSRFVSRGKIESLVDFPLELDLEQHVIGLKCDTVPRYKLYAISKHYGGMGGGHYVADATHQQVVPGTEAQWFHFNDSSVDATDGKSLVQNSAYVLFYRRVDSLAADEAAVEAREQAIPPLVAAVSTDGTATAAAVSSTTSDDAAKMPLVLASELLLGGGSASSIEELVPLAPLETPNAPERSAIDEHSTLQ